MDAYKFFSSSTNITSIRTQRSRFVFQKPLVKFNMWFLTGVHVVSTLSISFHLEFTKYTLFHKKATYKNKKRKKEKDNHALIEKFRIHLVKSITFNTSTAWVRMIGSVYKDTATELISPQNLFKDLNWEKH